MRRRGLTLLEVLVALVVLATGGLALQALIGRSVATIGTDARLTAAMLLARTELADAALAVPEPGRTTTETTGGLQVIRAVRPTAHPELREVSIEVRWGSAPGDAVELLEVIRVPAA